jgi:hypothetical protein
MLPQEEVRDRGRRHLPRGAADVTFLAGNFLAVVAAWFLVALPSNNM